MDNLVYEMETWNNRYSYTDIFKLVCLSEKCKHVIERTCKYSDQKYSSLRDSQWILENLEGCT